MTRKEAQRRLRKLYTTMMLTMPPHLEDAKALDIAINAIGKLNNNSTKLDKENVDLISRQDAIQVVREYLTDNQITDGDYHADGIERELYELPSAEPVTYCKDCFLADLCTWRREGAEYCSYAEQKTGHWIDKSRGDQKNSECSECHTLFRVLIHDYPYCPCCGSRNRGEEE